MNGYPSEEPCTVCQGHKDNKSEPRFGYTVCSDHDHVPPVRLDDERQVFERESAMTESEVKGVLREHELKAKEAGRCIQCQRPWYDGLCSCGAQEESQKYRRRCDRIEALWHEHNE